MTDEQKSEITGLRAAGIGYTVIARQMGLPRDTVRSFCRRNGLAGETAGRKMRQGRRRTASAGNAGRPCGSRKA